MCYLFIDRYSTDKLVLPIAGMGRVVCFFINAFLYDAGRGALALKDTVDTTGGGV